MYSACPRPVISAPVRSAFLISNATAGSVSPRAREVMVKALQADFKLEVAETERRDHASELARAAVRGNFDAVLVFGGDGTINEASQSLVGTDVALGLLPGGTTNVTARLLGVPRDPIDAAAFTAANLRSGTHRRVSVGRLNERYFLVSAGMGLDAEVARRVEAKPDKKKARGEWFWLSNALKVAATQYLGADPVITMRLPGTEPSRVVLAVCANARPFTYFKGWPVDALPEARLDAGLDLFGITKVGPGTIPRIVFSLFVSRSHTRWKNACYGHDVMGGRLDADHPLPVQVDGDYIGRVDRADLTLREDALTLLV